MRPPRRLRKKSLRVRATRLPTSRRLDALRGGPLNLPCRFCDNTFIHDSLRDAEIGCLNHGLAGASLFSE